MTPHQFAALPGVGACLPAWAADDPAWREMAGLVTPRGRGLGGALSEQGMLQLALQATAPFQTSRQGYVRYLQPRPPHGRREAPCRDFPRLLEALADELWVYDRLCSGLQQTVPRRLADSFHALHTLARTIPLVRGLFRQEPLRPQVQRALQILADELSTLARRPDPPPPLVPRLHDEFTLILIAQLQAAFRRYGPSRVSMVAADYAVAAILQQLGVEDTTGGQAGSVQERTLAMIVGTYRQRRARGEPTPSPLANALYEQTVQLFAVLRTPTPLLL
jgi:hypothetical protein